jgi:FixJ family two-component response regulator
MIPEEARHLSISRRDYARLALVDDDVSVRNGVSRLARAHGFHCTTFDSGESALNSPSLRDFDCLILDVQLPGLDGFEVRNRLEHQGIHLPVVFITAHSDRDSPEWTRHLKGSPCLSKPFEEEDFIGAVCRILNS